MIDFQKRLFSGSVSNDFVQKLFDAKKLFGITVLSDARYFETGGSGDPWYLPDYQGGSIAHTLVVTGYGTAIDPFDGDTKNDIEVSDTLTNEPKRTFRVDAVQLLSGVRHVYTLMESPPNRGANERGDIFFRK